MAPLKAHVHNGRLLLDAPTDLPEGEVVFLVPAEGLATTPEDATPDVDALQRELDASIAEADAGETEDFSELLTRLRAR